MKLLELFCLLSLFIVVILSCSNPVQRELLDYVNKDLPKIVNQELVATASYESVTGSNYRDDQTTYLVIRDNVIPNYKKFIEDLEAISTTLKTAEVRKLHESYIEAANTNYSAFSLFLSALEQGDYTLMSQTNEKLDKGRKLIRDWKAELNNLCDKNGVKLSNPAK